MSREGGEGATSLSSPSRLNHDLAREAGHVLKSLCRITIYNLADTHRRRVLLGVTHQGFDLYHTARFSWPKSEPERIERTIRD